MLDAVFAVITNETPDLESRFGEVRNVIVAWAKFAPGAKFLEDGER